MGETKKQTNRKKLISRIESSLSREEVFSMIRDAASMQDAVEFLFELYTEKELEEAIRG